MSGVSAESFTYDEMASSAEDVFRYTQENSKVPKSVTINGKTAADENYLNMLTNTVVKISNGNKAGSTVPNRKAPSNPQGTGKGTLTKSQYITVAKNINSFYSSNGQAPNFASSAVGDIRYESLIYGFSKVLYAYERDGTLPSEMSFPLVSGISSSGITVDTTPPSTSINLAGGWYNTVKTVTLTASDNKDAGPKVYYRINGGSLVSATKTASISLNQGIWNISYYSKDNKGNTESSKNVLYRIDVTAPTVSKNLSEGYYNNDTTLVLTANDNMDSNPTIYYNINNNGWISNVKTVNIPLIYGTNIVSYYSKDIAGNTGPIQTSTFYLMNTTPTINSSLEEGTYGITNVTLFVNDLADNNPLIYYSINGGDWNYAYKNTTISLWGGTYVINFYGVNNNGFNSSINSVTYIIDNTPPESSSNIESGEYNQSQLLNISAVDENDLDPSIYYSINYMNFIKANKSLILNLNNGSYFIRYYTMDKYGNKGPINSLMFSIGSNYNVVNLNTNKTYGLLQNAIDDPDTLDGHILEIINGIFNEIYLNKNLTLISKNRNISLDSLIITYNGSGSSINGFTIHNLILSGVNNCNLRNNSFNLRSNDLNNFYFYNIVSIYNSSNISIIESIINIKVLITSSVSIEIIKNNFTELSNNYSKDYSLEAYDSFLRMTSNSFKHIDFSDKNIIYLENTYAYMDFNAIFGSLKIVNSELSSDNNYWGSGRPFNRIHALNSIYNPNCSYIILRFEQEGDTLTIDYTANNKFDESASWGLIPEQKIIINTGSEIKEFYTKNGSFYYFLNMVEGFDINVTIENWTSRVYEWYKIPNNNTNLSGFNIDQILKASNSVKSYIENNHKLPTSVSIGNQSVSLPRFLKLLTDMVLKINNASVLMVSLSTVGSPTGPSETMRGGLINSTEYLDIAKRVSNYIVNNGVAPNYASSSLGNVGYNSLIYLFSKILSSYGVNGDLPYFVTIDNWTVISNSNTKFYDEYQIIDAAKRVKNYIETNKKLPTAVVINGQDVSMPTFLKILVTITLNIQGNYYTSVVARSFETASNPAENISSKNLNFTEYIEIASNVYTFMNTIGYAPNFATSSFGDIRYNNLIYIYSKILNFYDSNDYFPEQIVAYQWSIITSSSTTFFTKEQIISAASIVKSYIESNRKLPSSISIGGKNVTMPQFLLLSTELMLNDENYLSTSFILRNVNAPTTLSENISNKNLAFEMYMNITEYVNNFINQNNKPPSHVSINNTNLGYQSLVYMYSQILYSYSKFDNEFPDYISINPWNIVSSSSNSIFSMDDIILAAKNLKNYIKNNNNVSSSISVGGVSISMSQFLYLLTSTILNIDSKIYASIVSKNLSNWNIYKEDIMPGMIEFEEYFILASQINEYIRVNGSVPGYMGPTSIGENIGFYSLINIYCDVLSFYSTNKTFIEYIEILPWVTVLNPDKIYNFDNNRIFNSLQEAIDDNETLDGAVIGIGKKIIIENIIINKMVTIMSLFENTIIKYSNSNNSVITINNNGSGSVISGFIIEGHNLSSGIFLNNTNFCIIMGNTIKNALNGIYLVNSTENSICDNLIINNLNGIILYNNSESNSLMLNQINNNNASGIHINNSNFNTIYSNSIMNNFNGVYSINSSVDIIYNAIYNNSNHGLLALQNGIIDANTNWWGSNNPSISSNYGSDVFIENNNIWLDSWIIMKVESQIDRSNIKNSTYDNIIHIDLTYNNKGQPTSLSGDYIPDDLSIMLNTSLGTINNLYTKNGKASYVLKSSNIENINIQINLHNQVTSLNSAIISNNSLSVVNSRSGKNFAKIQDAIDDVDTLDGDTILIYGGIYTENIVIYKKLNLKSFNGSKVILKPIREYSNVITILGNGISIYDLEITGSIEGSGIFGCGNNISIVGNRIYGNKYGIYILGSKNSIFSNNTLVNNDFGMYLLKAEGSLISYNNVSNNWYGIGIFSSFINYLVYNTIKNNWDGIVINGSLDTSLHSNLITNNIQGVNLATTNHTKFYNNEIIDNMIGVTNYESNIILNYSNTLNNSLFNFYYINNTNIVMQNDIWGCGPATIATLMRLLGFNVTQEDLYNLSKTDNTGTSIYNLIQAAKIKGLNLTGVQILLGELNIGDIVLFDFDGEYHFSLIKDMNETHVMFYDSYFGNFELLLDIFEKYFSGFAIVLTENLSDNYTILSDEQLKSIKGTSIFINKGGFRLPSIGSIIKKAAVSLVRSPYFLAFAGAVQLGLLINPNVGAYGPRLSSKPYKTTYPRYSPKYNYKLPKIPKYVRSPTGKIRYILNPAYVTPAVKIAQEYQRNYEKYKKLKGKEFLKIGTLISLGKNKEEIEFGRMVVDNSINQKNSKSSVPIPKGNETLFIMKLYKYVKNSPKEAYKHYKNGDYLKCIGRITLGTGIGEYLGFYLTFKFVPDKALENIITQITKE